MGVSTGLSMDHPDEPFFPRSYFAFASPGVPQKEQRVRYTYTGLELPSPFGGRSPLCSKREAPFEKGGPHYVASPMPGFSPGVGRVGMSPFAEFAAGLPTLCTPGLVKDGVVASPIMREVMLHAYSEESPMHQCRSHPNPKKLFHSSTPGESFGMREAPQSEDADESMHYDPFGEGPAKPVSRPGTDLQGRPVDTSFDTRPSGNRRGSAADGAPPRDHKPCSCKKSRCLKKYCECFAAGKFCEGCYCTGCQNTLNHKPDASDVPDNHDVQKHDAVNTPVVPAAALPSPVEREGSPSMFAKGCHCKKSRCQKKYCECFQMNVLCSTKCECRECMNRSWDQRSPSARERGVQPRKRPRGGRPAMVKDVNHAVVEPMVMPMMSALHQMDPMASAQLQPYAHMQQVTTGLASLEKTGNSQSPGLLDTSIHSDLDMTFVGAFGEALTTDTPARSEPMLFHHLQSQPVVNDSRLQDMSASHMLHQTV